MQQVMEPRRKTMNPQLAPSRLQRKSLPAILVLGLSFSAIALFVVPAMLGETNLPAPTNAQHATRPAQEVPVANPANQAPKQASVSWDSRGLEIEAFNSSLNQILRQVAVASGG